MTKKFKTTIFFILSTIIIIILAITVFRLHYSTLYQSSNDKLYLLEILSDEIVYHDEVLSMSALAYLLTEDDKWIKRYQKHVILLDSALLNAMSDKLEIRKVIKKTSVVNDKLLKIEEESFELLKLGEKAHALALLQSKKYQLLKQEYMQSISSGIELLHEYETNIKDKIINNSFYLSVLLISFILFFIIIWLFLIYYIRSSDKYLRKLVVIDALTGLHNRRTFNKVLNREVNRNKREGRILLLAICDVDNFKLYNDTYGHPAGDKVLKSIGKVISQKSKRTTEFSYRIGGEEFALINSVDTLEEGKQWIQSIITVIELLDIKHEKNPPLNLVTISAGVTFSFKDDKSSCKELYHQADKALYKAKSAGKNCFVEFSII